MSTINNNNPIPIALPQPEEVTEKERDDAMGSYLMTLATIAMGLPLPLLSLITSIIYHYVNAAKSRFVAFHSLQALLSEIPISILNAVLVVWGAVIFFSGASSDYIGLDLGPFWFFLVLTLLITTAYIIISLVAAFRAKKGNFVYFWFFGAIAYRRYYVLGKGGKANVEQPNLPPKGY